jgi:hypothetical protein
MLFICAFKTISVIWSLFLQPIFRELIRGLKSGSRHGKFSPCSFIKRWKTTDLDNVQFICGVGILGPQHRYDARN